MSDRGARALGGSNRVPPRGRDKTFDRYYDENFGSGRDESDNEELRQAAWATWKTAAPSGSNHPTGADRRQTEDEELARAIALSVNDHKGQKGSAIDLTEDSDEEDVEVQRVIAISQEEVRAPNRPRRDDTPEEERKLLAKALAASLAQATPGSDDDIPEPVEITPPTGKTNGTSPPRSSTPSKPTPIGPTSATTDHAPHAPAPRMQMNGALGDRAQMEKERLARQAARDQPIGNGSHLPAIATNAPAKAPKVYVTANVRTMADIKASASPTPPPSTSGTSTPANPHHPFQAAAPFPSDAGGEYYPDGEMRHTALTIGNPTTERTFSPQQMTGNTSQISLIVMSSFVLDDEWIETFLPPAESVPRVMIRPHPKEYHTAWNGKVQAQSTGEVRCYPKMVGDWGSAHMKFAWIFYKTGRLRVVVLTANMVPYDWEWIENTVFIQDILPSRDQSTHPHSHDFPSRFRWLFAHLKVHKALRFLKENHPQGANIPLDPSEAFDDLDKYDWSRVKVRLLMSVPNTYGGAESDDFGVCRLGKILNEEGWKPQAGEIVKIEFQGSSLGTITLDWADTFYQYCSGKTTANLINKLRPKAWPPIKIIFPTLATVDASKLGRDGGGTMFCGKAFTSVTRPLFHDANSKRDGVLMHSKVLFGIFEPRPDNLGFAKSPSGNAKRKASEMEDENTGVGGWGYVGSHNFSPSAWGRVSFKKTAPSLSISNYELGIVFALPRQNTQTVADAIAPYVRPPRPYASTDTPWDQSIRDT